MFPQDVPPHYSGPSIPEVELADIETHPIVRPKPAEEAKIAELAEESATARAASDVLERKIAADVIVHELLHLLVPNHGKLFKSLMNAYLPGWEKRVDGRANRLCGSQSAGRIGD